MGKKLLMALAWMALALCLILAPFAWAEGTLTADQIDYLRGAFNIPRDIVVTEYDCFEPYYWDAGETWLMQVTLYSNGQTLAGAAVTPDGLDSVRNILMYSDKWSDPSKVKRERKNAWTKADANYIKSAFGIPWDAQLEFECGEPFYWEGGDLWLESVAYYKNGDLVAGASLDADADVVDMVSEIYMYTGD